MSDPYADSGGDWYSGDYTDYSGYGSDGSSVTTSATSTAIKQADSSMLDNFLKVIGVGATAYAQVKAAEAPKTPTNTGPYYQQTRTGTPVIGTVVGGTTVSPTNMFLIAGGVIVALVLGLFLMRRK